MPSTDIDGSPILILDREQSMLILGMAQRLDTVRGPEQKLLNRIKQTFPSKTEIGHRELRMVYSIQQQAHEIGYMEITAEGPMFRLIVRVSDRFLSLASPHLDTLSRLGVFIEAIATDTPTGKVFTTSPHCRLPDTWEVRDVIDRLLAITSSS